MSFNFTGNPFSLTKHQVLTFFSFHTNGIYCFLFVSLFSRKIGIEEPDLGRNSLARSGVKLLLICSVQHDNVQTLVGRLVDQPSLLRVDPLLIFGDGTGNHLDLLVAGSGKLSDFCAGVLSSELKVFGKREELRGRHGVVARVGADDVIVLKVETI